MVEGVEKLRPEFHAIALLLTLVFLASDRSQVWMPFPGRKFIGAEPNRGDCAGCLAVFNGQSKASRSYFGVTSPLPPSTGSRSRSGRQRLVGEELQLAAVIVGPYTLKPV